MKQLFSFNHKVFKGSEIKAYGVIFDSLGNKIFGTHKYLVGKNSYGRFIVNKTKEVKVKKRQCIISTWHSKTLKLKNVKNGPYLVSIPNSYNNGLNIIVRNST